MHPFGMPSPFRLMSRLQSTLVKRGAPRIATQKIAAFEIEPRIELLAEMRVTLEATKTRFLAEGVLQG